LARLRSRLVERSFALLKRSGNLGRLTPRGIDKCCPKTALRRDIMLGTILLVIVVLMLLGAIPTWPHSRNWGYYPSDGLGLVLLILIILLLLGRI
jgi:hypothetical protein